MRKREGYREVAKVNNMSIEKQNAGECKNNAQQKRQVRRLRPAGVVRVTRVSDESEGK